jgi:hypothetical protein
MGESQRFLGRISVPGRIDWLAPFRLADQFCGGRVLVFD